MTLKFSKFPFSKLISKLPFFFSKYSWGPFSNFSCHRNYRFRNTLIRNTRLLPFFFIKLSFAGWAGTAVSGPPMDTVTTTGTTKHLPLPFVFEKRKYKLLFVTKSPNSKLTIKRSSLKLLFMNFVVINFKGKFKSVVRVMWWIPQYL